FYFINRLGAFASHGARRGDAFGRRQRAQSILGARSGRADAAHKAAPSARRETLPARRARFRRRGFADRRSLPRVVSKSSDGLLGTRRAGELPVPLHAAQNAHALVYVHRRFSRRFASAARMGGGPQRGRSRGGDAFRDNVPLAVPALPCDRHDVPRGLRPRRHPHAPRHRPRRQKDSPPDRRLHGRAHTGEPAASLPAFFWPAFFWPAFFWPAFFWPAFFWMDLSGGRGGSGRMVFTRQRRGGKATDE